jgi:hypothetical protein
VVGSGTVVVKAESSVPSEFFVVSAEIGGVVVVVSVAETVESVPVSVALMDESVPDGVFWFAVSSLSIIFASNSISAVLIATSAGVLTLTELVSSERSVEKVLSFVLSGVTAENFN